VTETVRLHHGFSASGNLNSARPHVPAWGTVAVPLTQPMPVIPVIAIRDNIVQDLNSDRHTPSQLSVIKGIGLG